MENFLAIDYGTKRIGLAYNVLSLAEPLFVVDNQIDDKNPIANNEALEKISQVCQERKIDKIILGLSESLMAVKIKHFAKLIDEKIHLPIILVDETLSSHEVGQRMKEAGFPLKKRQGPIDHYSAALILEAFLETLPT